MDKFLFRESITGQSFEATGEQIDQMFNELNSDIRYGELDVSVNNVIDYINLEIIRDKDKYLSKVEPDLYWYHTEISEIRYEFLPALTLDGKTCLMISYINSPKDESLFNLTKEASRKDILVESIARVLSKKTEEQLAEKIFDGTFGGIFSCEDCPAVMLCTKMLPGAFDEPNGLTCKDVLIKFMKED